MIAPPRAKPPPEPPIAWLPENVVLLTLRFPPFEIAPPTAGVPKAGFWPPMAWFPLNRQFVTVTAVPPLRSRAPPWATPMAPTDKSFEKVEFVIEITAPL